MGTGKEPGIATCGVRGRASYLRALPPYPGGKRRLLPAIFALINDVLPASEWPRSTLADPFMGAGSVALSAKARGFSNVVANDIASRSAVVGRAHIANSRERLHQTDVCRLFHNDAVVGTPDWALSRRLPADVAGFLQDALGATDRLPTPRKDLLHLVLIKWLLGLFPMSLPSATDARHYAANDLDTLSGPRLRHYLRSHSTMLHPGRVESLADEVNGGVFPGRGSMSQMDAFDFLADVQADVVYLDPPYPGTTSYEAAFRLLDEVFGDRPGNSRFSGKRPPLNELLDACSHIPVMILSLNDATVSADELVAVVEKHREVRRVISLPYRHFGALATERKNATNREVLVLGVRR